MRLTKKQLEQLEAIETVFKMTDMQQFRLIEKGLVWWCACPENKVGFQLTDEGRRALEEGR